MSLNLEPKYMILFWSWEILLILRYQKSKMGNFKGKKVFNSNLQNRLKIVFEIFQKYFKNWNREFKNISHLVSIMLTSCQGTSVKTREPILVHYYSKTPDFIYNLPVLIVFSLSGSRPKYHIAFSHLVSPVCTALCFCCFFMTLIGLRSPSLVLIRMFLKLNLVLFSWV